MLYRRDAGSQWHSHVQLRAPALRGVIAKCSLQSTLHEGELPETGSWVEVEITSAEIVVFADSLRSVSAMRHLGSSDDRREPTTAICLDARIRLLPPELQRLVGKVSIPEDGGNSIIDAIRRGEKVFGVSDGSASRGLAAHGWKLARKPNDPMAISGSGPVDGRTPTAFRAEMQGQVAVLIVSSLLVAARGIRRANIISLCDNRATLRRLAAHSRTLRVRDHVESETDLFLVYRDWMRKNHVQPTPLWVKGHQDRTTPLSDISTEGLLNIEVDKLATTAHMARGMPRSAPSADTFATDVYSVFIDGEKITANLKSRVLDRCGEDPLRKYLLHKHQLSDGKIDGINWTALRGYLNSMSAPRRATQVKLQHGWIPTNSPLYLQGRAKSDVCPLCASAPETLRHVRCCNATSTFRRERIERLCRDLRGINTAPEIVQCWRCFIYDECGEPADYNDTGITMLAPGLANTLAVARRHQSVLSWEGFLQGRISKKWNDVQYYHERRRVQETASHSTRQPWDRQVVRLVCEFHSDLWSHRNDEVHGRTQLENQQKLRADVEARVHALYDRHPTLLPRYPSIYAVPVEAQLKRSTLALQMWLKQVLQQERLTDIHRQKARMEAGSIERFLQPRDFTKMWWGLVNLHSSKQQVAAATRISRWWIRLVRVKPKMSMPRMGIGDPG